MKTGIYCRVSTDNQEREGTKIHQRTDTRRIGKSTLKAAMSAPSAHNGQPWSFVVITERKILDAVPSFHPYSSMLKNAPLAIAVCGDSKFQPLFWVQGCSAATENILLGAHALGLGAGSTVRSDKSSL